MILERKLEALSEELEKKEAQLAEVLAASNLDASTLHQVNAKLEEVLENKNSIIRALQYDVAKVGRGFNLWAIFLLPFLFGLSFCVWTKCPSFGCWGSFVAFPLLLGRRVFWERGKFSLLFYNNYFLFASSKMD